MFEGGTRSATVTAVSRVRILRLERADLMERMEELPGLAIGICQALSRRLRQVTESLERASPREAGSGESAAGKPQARG